MFGPLIFRQVQKFQRRRPKQSAVPQQRQPARQAQQPVQQQAQNNKQQPIEDQYYEEEIPVEGDFVDPINN